MTAEDIRREMAAVAGTEKLLKHPGLLEWLLHGETGISSKTIVSRTTGYNLDRWQSEPYDPSDFRRCELLLRRVPTLRILMPRMNEVSPWWAYLVNNWQLIVDTCEEEVPDWFTTRPHGSAPRAYALIKAGRRR